MKQSIEERRSFKLLLNQVKNLIDTMEEIINKNTNQYKFSVCNEMVRRYQVLVEQSTKFVNFNASYDSYDVNKLRNVYDMTGIDQQNLFYSVLLSTKNLYSTLCALDDYVDDEFNNFYNMISKRFRSMFYKEPANEKEVQDNFERLLNGQNYDKGIDYERESGKFSFSGKEYIPDFVLKKLKLCIEIKFSRNGNKSKIIEEINADITAYSKQYSNILFVIYDCGAIRDEAEFRSDIESIANVKVLIVKH